MVSAYPELGTGTTIAFGTSAFAATVMELNIGGSSRAAVDTTKLNPTLPSGVQEGGRTSKPGKVQALEPIVMKIQYDVRTSGRPPINGDAETVTITFPDGSTYAGSGYITKRSNIVVGVDQLITCDIEVSRSGIWA